MIQNLKIDQARTFASMLRLSCEPKTAFGDPVPPLLGRTWPGFGFRIELSPWAAVAAAVLKVWNR